MSPRNPLVVIGIKEPSQLSARGAKFVARFEGFVATPYNDPDGNATIGFGHLLHRGNVDAQDHKDWPVKITVAHGLSMLRHDAAIASASVRRYITTHLTQPQFDALCDFAYNCGPYALHGSMVASVVNARAFAHVRAELAEWDHGSHGFVIPGLETRRDAEARLFLTGKYDG